MERMKGLKMRKRFVVLLGTVVMLAGCSSWLKTYDGYVQSVNFTASNYTLKVDGILCCNVNCSPVDSPDYLRCEFKVDNTDICEVYDQNGSSCFVRGLSEGYTVLTCTIGNKSAKCVVNVNGK